MPPYIKKGGVYENSLRLLACSFLHRSLQDICDLGRSLTIILSISLNNTYALQSTPETEVCMSHQTYIPLLFPSVVLLRKTRTLRVPTFQYGRKRPQTQAFARLLSGTTFGYQEAFKRKIAMLYQQLPSQLQQYLHH